MPDAPDATPPLEPQDDDRSAVELVLDISEKTSLLIHGIAWFLNDLFFEEDVWLGFFVEAAFWLVVAALAGLFAYRSVKAGAPPTPELAIEEAKRTKQAFEGEP